MKKIVALAFTLLWTTLPAIHAMDKDNTLSGTQTVRACVFCSADDKIPETYKEAAFQLGEGLAKSKATLITGGSNTGLMKQVVDGFTTINKTDVYGVLPDVFKSHQIEHPAIPVEHVIWTKDMAERFKKYHELSNTCIVLPGGFGTLHELMDFLVCDQFGIHKTTIILANFDGYWDHLLSLFRGMMDRKALYFKHFDSLKMATTVGEIIELLGKKTEVTHDGLNERFWEDSPKVPKETYSDTSIPQ